ncbi:DnaJ domain-containing protein [Chloroflexota bacterium]
MKDYYRILGVVENAGQKEIKQAFRKLAFQHHPDTNPDRGKEAEEKFKEINEAYCILGDESKRKQYDLARKGGFAGYPYSQQDIFRSSFTNSNVYDELSRMFSQGGLRFDTDFLNQVFFTGRGIMFQFFNSPGTGSQFQNYERQAGFQASPASVYKPNWLERQLGKIATKMTGFLVRRVFGVPRVSGGNLDYHTDIEVTNAEADAGTEKEFTYQRNEQSKKLMVKIPAKVKSGTKIRLKGMGMVSGGRSGDLYLRVKIRN